jgi:hypothetical protein
VSEHTPGPWVARVFPTAAGGRNSTWILDAIPDQDGKVIANAICQTAASNDDQAANARLIAAAPDLLAACRAFLAQLDYLRDLWGDEGVTRTIADKARHALSTLDNNEGGAA